MADPSPDLLLIDGNSLAYRAFFALPESIATSTGQPTNAIFGFASMLVKVLTEHGQQPTIVAWDRGTSGRQDVYAEYKGTRSGRPDLLKEQWPHLEPLVAAFGYRNVSVEGYEADDVIGTIAERARLAGIPTTILTGDRDIFQLIDPESKVRVMATARGITETKLYDHAAVVERYGIPPELIPDFYGLKGDTSDNIPGVPGIGDKTAAQLLQTYGTLEEVLAHVDDISGAKRKENLVAHADDARVSKVLATILRDVPVDLDPAAEVAREPDRSELRAAFRKFELRDPLRRLEEFLGRPEESAGSGVPMNADVRLRARVQQGGPQDVRRLAGESSAPMAIVLRAPEVSEGALFAAEEHWRFAVALTPPGAGTLAVHGICAGPDDIVPLLDRHDAIAHDAKGLGVVPRALVHDTMLAAFLLDPARRGFPFPELCEERGLATDIKDELAAEAVLMLALAAQQGEQLAERGLTDLLTSVELPLVSVLRRMELAGVRLNTERLGEISTRVAGEILSLERQIWDLADEEFTIGSPQQLGAILFDKLGLSKKRRGKTGFSTDARVLQAIRDEHEIVPVIERWRELNQLMKTYLAVLPGLVDDERRIHTTFLQVGAATGRLASTDPNLQNVPVRTPLGREIRACFEAAPGRVLVAADYSQVELRILAEAAGEDVLKDIFLRGEDVHTATAREVFQVAEADIDPGMRSKAKMINYGIVYGLSDYGLADRLNIPREEAKTFIDAYLARFAAVKAFMDATIAQATEQGYVTTLFGRRRQIPELKARNYQVRTLGERLAVNTVIQGTAADIMKLAMIETAAALQQGCEGAQMILTIHDELLFECVPEQVEAVKAIAHEHMVSPWGDRTPPLAVDVGVGTNWLQAK